MNYLVEIIDTWGRRVAQFDEVPLLRAIRRTPDQSDEIRGILPAGVTDLSPGYRVRVFVEGALFCDTTVTRVTPRWSDSRKLILDRFVRFHETIEFESARPGATENRSLTRAYINQTISAIVKDAINRTLGPVHYYVKHTAYPGGAEREFTKFSARQTDENELEIGGIAQGQWVGSNRIDATGAFAKDGDTIAGLVVDGGAWPDVRLMMVDTEETTRNSHAEDLHPEVAFWTDAEYDASGYKVKADAATAFLQNLLDTHGIDFIELNPHQDATGAFDDRVDAFGRYIGLVYGGGQCFNAAIIEQGHSEVLLFQDGAFHVPEHELKDFFSYSAVHEDSIEITAETLLEFDVSAGIQEILTALSYAAGNFIWSMDTDFGVTFRKANQAGRVAFFDPVAIGVALGSDSTELTNTIFFDGNPVAFDLSKTYTRGESIDEYGFRSRGLDYFSLSREEDADKLVEGLLADVAYPEPTGEIEFFRGDAHIRVGDIIELRDGPLRRLDRELAGEWDGLFSGRHAGRVKEVTHRFSGKEVRTVAQLTSPLRSVANPISFMVRSQPGSAALFQFRLDDETVGLDMGVHLD